jgi:hypothetical protein
MKLVVTMDPLDAKEYLLEWAVSNMPGDRVEVMRFRNPHDCGETFVLTRRVADDLAYALTNRGGHFIYRDDAPDLQLKLPLALEEAA